MATANLLPYFPEDVLIEIFLKLPARLLFLFRSVSKRWLALIQNPTFTHMQLSRATNNQHDYTSLLILHSVKTKSHCSKEVQISLALISKYGDILSYKDEVSLEALSPFLSLRYSSFKKNKLCLLGPCNGLFCMTESDMVDIVVFNPMTRQFREVPPSPLTSHYRYPYHVKRVTNFDSVCFGYDSVSHDYKVVRFCGIDLKEKGGDNHTVEIFILSTNTWSQADHVVRYMPASSTDVLFFNGAFHWVGYFFQGSCLISVFDLNEEAFKQFNLPDYVVLNDYALPHLSMLDDYFTVVVHTKWYYWNDKIEIWVMKEYWVHDSWTKLYNINTGMGIRRQFSFYNDQEYLLEDSEGRLLFLNLKSRTIQNLKVFRAPMFAFTYRESLVSPSISE